MMTPKTTITNLFLLILLHISNFSTIVFSMEQYVRKDYKSEYTIRPGTVTHVVVSNELYGLKKGNAGFVCAHGPRYGERVNRYAVLKFEHTGIIRYTFINCHVRSNRGFVNFPVYLHPDTSAHCYPSYVCKYSIRKDGVYYKHENKFYPWQQFPSPAKGNNSKAYYTKRILPIKIM